MNLRLLMIGGWTDIYQKAKLLGFDVTLIQKKSNIKPKDFELVDQIFSCDLNHNMIPDLAKVLHAAKPFDAVVSFQELGLMNAAIIGDRLGIASNPKSPVLLTCNKGKMREHLEQLDIASIPFKVSSSVADVIGFGRQYGWPIILKPIGGTGSKQIHKLYSEDEVDSAFSSILKDFPDIHPIAEKFIAGPEVSIEGFSWDGKHTILGVTDKITSGAPYFVETGHNMPSSLSPDIILAIKTMTEKFLISIGHKNGPSHTEAIVTEQGPVIIESHTRTGGDRIFEMVELVHGVDMIGATLQGYVGDVPKINIKRESGAAIRYLTLPPGEIMSVSGLDQARESKGVVHCDIELSVGTKINASKNSNERHGYILAVGESREAAVQNVEDAMKKVHVKVA
ncbi:biotin carboxylase [Oxalobacteraceae bacterium GrIS 1.11]